MNESPYGPADADFYDQTAIRKEIDRVFDICVGCRRCLPLCPSFPALFDAADRVDGDCEKVPDADWDRVADLCYQCKLCYPHCPYTPADDHRFAIDFPRLMLRSKAARAKRDGVTTQDKVLGAPDLIGFLGGLTAPFSNWANQLSANRLIAEKTLGIARGRRLPTFHRQSFEKWWSRRHGPSPKAPPSEREVTLFPTCFVNWHDPDTGKAAVGVLEHNRCSVSSPPFQCCGMPALDGGDMEGFRRNAEANLEVLALEVDAGRDVVVPGPTCSFVIKNEYPSLLTGEAAETAARVAKRTFDVCEYLMVLKRRKELDTDFHGPAPATIAYHLPCHLKVQNIGFKSRDVLKLIPGTKVTMIDQCSAMDGTWGMKREFYELSKEVAKPLFDAIDAAKPDAVVSDCPLAAIQISEGTGAEPVHPVKVLRDAYGLPHEA